MTQRSRLRAEHRIGVESRRLNRLIYSELLQKYNTYQFQELVRQVNLWVVDTFVDAIVYGYAFGRKQIRRELKLSLERDINRLLEPREYELLKVQFEGEARQWSSHLRADLSQIMIKWAQYANSEGLTPEQAATSLQLAFRAKGYSPKNARNIRNVFQTGFYMGVNGVIYVETRNNPDVWGYRYRTAGDEKVRAAHIAQQGVVLPKTDPFWMEWWPPNGYNCRCIIDVLTEEENIVLPDQTFNPDPNFAGNPFMYFIGL